MLRYGKLFLLFLLALAVVRRAPAQEILDRIVAVVDDKIILQSELNQFTYQLAMQMGIDPRRDQEKFDLLQQTALDNLVDQKVLLTKAQEDSVVVDERQVDQVLEDRLKSMIQQLGSEEKVEEYFGQPMRKVRRTLRAEISEALLVRSLQQKKMRDLKISRREVEQFYHTYRDSLPSLKASVKLSHVLLNIQPGEAAVARARERIERLLVRVRAGEDFTRLAAENSEDPGSSKRGGELGFIQRGDFVREFEEAAFALQPGEISEVVQSQFGFHIIQLIDRRGEKINARHILVRVPTTPEDEAGTRQRLEEIRNEILQGNLSLEQAAGKYSSDKTTSDKGGNLGWFEVDQLQVAAFREAARNLQPGEISEPIKTEFGYHLVRLDERREPRQFNLTQDWKQLEEMALNHKGDREMRAWIDSLKRQMYIRVVEKS